MQELINVTVSAVSKIWELITEEGNPDLKLRVYVTGGGCSGLQYGFAFDAAVADDDSLIVHQLNENKVCVVVDALSLQYLTGAEIDYKQDIEGEHFIIRNPNAKTTCGCGSSFTSAEDEGDA